MVCYPSVYLLTETTNGTLPISRMKREYPESPLVGVGAVIIDAGRVLLVKRGHAPLFGEWSIPGGLLEVGETVRQAVVREAQEETSLTVETGELLGVYDRLLPDGDGRTLYHYVLIDFLCRRAGRGSYSGGGCRRCALVHARRGREASLAGRHGTGNTTGVRKGRLIVVILSEANGFACESVCAVERSLRLPLLKLTRGFSSKIERPANPDRACGPPGGLFWIDQEVVTLRGPFGELRVLAQPTPGGSTLNHR